MWNFTARHKPRCCPQIPQILALPQTRFYLRGGKQASKLYVIDTNGLPVK